MRDIFDSAVEEAVAETVATPSMTKLRKMFMHFTENCGNHRQLAFRDRRYYDGDQLSAAWEKNLDDNDVPRVTINLIKENIAAHIGLIAAQQTEIRAFARTQAGAPAAETATKLLRYAIDSSKLEIKFREASEQFFIEGIGVLLIECDAENVYVTLIDYRDFIYDPNSRRSDFSDAKWMGFSRWLPVQDVEDAYPEAFARLSPSGDTNDFFVLAEGFSEDTDNERPAWTKGGHSINVVEMYYLEAGQWMNVVFCHKGVLDHGPSQYIDDFGRSICPIVAEACHTKADPSSKNQRYGQVRDLTGAQDDYNSRRHTALKYAMSRDVQMVDPSAQPVDAETLRSEVQRRISIVPNGYQVTDKSVSSEQVSFMNIAAEEMRRMSPAAAVTGTNLPDDASGRSRQLAAAGGRLSLTPVLSRVQDWRENLYRHAWYRVTQFWHGQMEVRITGNVNAPKYLQLNVPIIDEAQPQIPQLVVGEDGQPAVDEQGQPVIEMVPNILRTENEVAKMDIDFTFTTQERHNSLTQEVWDSLMTMISSLQVQFGSPEFRLALEWYDMPNKQEVLERYDAQVEKMQQDNAGQAQMQQKMAAMQAQLEMLVQQSKADKDASTAALNAAKAERTHAETAVAMDGYNNAQEAAQIIAQEFLR